MRATIDLSPTLRQLMAATSPAGRKIRLATSHLSGLALAYTPAAGKLPHRLALSRVGTWPSDHDLKAATLAIGVVAGAVEVRQARPKKAADRDGRLHYCRPLVWRPVEVAGYFDLSPAEQAKLRKVVRK